MNEIQGHYCCVAPKISSVFSASTAPAFSGSLSIHSGWIYALYADGKMSAQQARSEVIKYRRDVARVLQCIDAAPRAASAQQLQCLLQYVDVAQAMRAQPRRYVPEVEDVFLRQYHVFSDRRKFLVLTGPSGMGKTEYILSLAKAESIIAGIRERYLRYRQQWHQPDRCPFPPGKALMEVAGSRGLDQLPDVRELSPLKHARLFIDEGTPQMALKHRRLFKGNSGFAPTGLSATNCHAYLVVS